MTATSVEYCEKYMQMWGTCCRLEVKRPIKPKPKAQMVMKLKTEKRKKNKRDSQLLIVAMCRIRSGNIHDAMWHAAMVKWTEHANHIIQNARRLPRSSIVTCRHARIKVNSPYHNVNGIKINASVFCSSILEFCTTLLDTQNCRRTELSSNYIFYDAASCACSVFTTNCLKDEGTNMFETFEECWTACPEELENCSGGGEATERPVDTGIYRRGRIRPKYWEWVSFF